MVGVEARPRPSTPATTQPIPSSHPELEAARLRLTEATVAQAEADKLALEDDENDAAQKEFKKRKQAFQQAQAEFPKLAKAQQSKTPDGAPTTPTDIDPNITSWNRRHDQAYRLIQMSLSDPYKELTFECLDLTSTWLRLKNHFESNAAADIMAAEAELELLKLSEADDILEITSG